ncbi:multidrug efflux protein NorA [compost metagenome]
MLAFNLGLGAVGVWWGLALGLACAAVSLTWAFEWRMKRLLGSAGGVNKVTASVV